MITASTPRPVLPCLALALALALAASQADAATGTGPSLQLLPGRVRPGDAFLVRVRAGRGGPLDPARVEGDVAGRRLSFFALDGGVAAIGALPVETPPGPLPIRIEAGDGPLLGHLLVAAPRFPARALRVPPRFVERPDPGVQARIDDDRAAFARAFSRPAGPPLFASPFVLPRRARVTAGYGELRTLNGVKPSQHYGLDLAGPEGAPVAASNDGEVVLVRDCWASGRTVILRHGAGVYTAYFHLARALVVEGQRVARGQRIGRVGATGRASGPHLHWSVRVGDLYVDPASVLRLRLRARPQRPSRRAPP